MTSARVLAPALGDHLRTERLGLAGYLILGGLVAAALLVRMARRRRNPAPSGRDARSMERAGGAARHEERPAGSARIQAASIRSDARPSARWRFTRPVVAVEACCA